MDKIIIVVVVVVVVNSLLGGGGRCADKCRIIVVHLVLIIFYNWNVINGQHFMRQWTPRETDAGQWHGMAPWPRADSHLVNCND